MDKQMIARCGAYCGTCEWREKTNCQGCQASNGKMFWGECTVAKCSIEKEHNHCGHCSKLPCEDLQSAFDNPDHGDNGERLLNLQGWRDGKDTYLELTKRKSKL
jgi:hypothetical protein